jgi:ubiquinone/menaquinone biosynthesis C-methylase UbiE
MEYVPYDRAASFYEESRRIPDEVLNAAVSIVASDPALRPDLPFLDVAAGTGRFSRLLAERLPWVAALDISSAMLAQAASAGVCAVRADARRLPVRNGGAGGALIVHLLHLVADWRGVLGEVRRTLAPGAPLFLVSESGRQFATRELYFQVAGRRGYLRPPLGARSAREPLDYLEATGATIRPVDQGALAWAARDLLELLRRNPYSHLWHLSAEEHDALMLELLAEVRARRIPLDREEEAPAQLGMWRVVWP